MGILNLAKESYNGGRKRAHAEAETRRLRRRQDMEGVEIIGLMSGGLNSGEIVTFQFSSPKQLCQLSTLAKKLNIRACVCDNKVQFVCPDLDTAEGVRTGWK